VVPSIYKNVAGVTDHDHDVGIPEERSVKIAVLFRHGLTVLAEKSAVGVTGAKRKEAILVFQLVEPDV
jgi:hypothetical protein